MPEPVVFTHDLLFASASPDDVEERGPITMAEARALFRSFPFARELEKRAANPDLMMPTIALNNQSDGSSLAIWAEEPGSYVLWCPSAAVYAEGVEDPVQVETCIGLFFDRKTNHHAEWMAVLGPESS